MTIKLVSRWQPHLRERPPPHVWYLQKSGYLLVYNIFTKNERQTRKSPNTQGPFTISFCKIRNQIPFLWAHPLSKLEISFRRKKSLLIHQKNSSLNFQKRLLQQYKTGLFTLKAKPWYGKEAQLKCYIIFFFYYSPFPLHMPVKTIKYLWEKCRRHGFTFQKIYFHVLHTSQSTTQESQANTLWPTSAAVADEQPFSIRALPCISCEK